MSEMKRNGVRRFYWICIARRLISDSNACSPDGRLFIAGIRRFPPTAFNVQRALPKTVALARDLVRHRRHWRRNDWRS